MRILEQKEFLATMIFTLQDDQAAIFIALSALIPALGIVLIVAGSLKRHHQMIYKSGGRGLVFFCDRPSQQEVDAFISEMMAMRNAFVNQHPQGEGPEK